VSETPLGAKAAIHYINAVAAKQTIKEVVLLEQPILKILSGKAKLQS
jgi:hypothetical protein